MRWTDESGHRWKLEFSWCWSWGYIRRPFESYGLLDGGSHVWRIGPLEICKRFRHDDTEPDLATQLAGSIPQDILRRAWSAETSSDPEGWSAGNPAWGQCAVTALCVQDALGGEIVWAEALLPDGRAISHYFNCVDGAEIDLTRSQFPAGTQIPRGVPKAKSFPSTRDYILSFAPTRMRYEALKRALDA